MAARSHQLQRLLGGHAPERHQKGQRRRYKHDSDLVGCGLAKFYTQTNKKTEIHNTHLKPGRKNDPPLHVSVHVVAAAAKVRSVRAGDKTIIGLRSGDRPHAGVPASGSKTQKRRV